MADKAGRLGKLAISTDGGVNYNEIEGITEVTLKIDQKTIDVTDHDSGAWEEFIVGRKNWSLSVKCNYDDAATYQAAVVTAIFNGTIPYWRYRPDTGGGLVQFKGAGLPKGLEDSSPNENQTAFSFEVQGTGTLTKDTQ